MMDADQNQTGAGPGEPARRVLLVEDERHIRELVQLHLGLEGCDTTAVGNGEEALAVLELALDVDRASDLPSLS